MVKINQNAEANSMYLAFRLADKSDRFTLCNMHADVKELVGICSSHNRKFNQDLAIIGVAIALQQHMFKPARA